MTGFVHLHVHSEYALVDSTIRVKPLVKATTEAGMPAVAITDPVNLFSLVRFYRAAEGAGVKPIVGSDLWLPNPADPGDPHRLVVLCRNDAGYRNLTRLISRAYLERGPRSLPLVQPEWLDEVRDGEPVGAGLIALSGGMAGEIGRALLAGEGEAAGAALEVWRQRFPDGFYLEVTRTGRPGEEDHLHAAADLAARSRTPVVATNDVRFLSADDFEAHEARVAIHQSRTLDDPRRPRDYSAEQYLRTPAEMAELFADLPEALENTVAVAERCNLTLSLGENYLPDFPVPEGMTTAEHLAEEARTGLDRRLATDFGVEDPHDPAFAETRVPYDQRLDRELGVINEMGFPGYFLIVADFIRWAKENGIPVGPGRGSGAGSLVAYAQTITDLDPLKYDLLFERFLNPERVSMPDFDVDFCMERRDDVIDYVADKYGREKVSQIITYGSMAAKAVVRDTGRVLGHPYGFVDSIAKLIPFEIGITLDKALEQEEALKERYDNDDEVRAVIDLARSLEGLTRNAGKHAGGVVIAPTDLTDFTPLYQEEDADSPVTQFDKDDVEAVGLVKFDFLGLRTLTIIDWAMETVNAQRAEAGEEPVDIAHIPLDDKGAFDLLKACRTTAVFQLESRGMKDLIRRLRPDSFEDVIALVALYRPGPLQSGMVDDFINRKHGEAAVAYPTRELHHDALEPILGPTYGVILYQEQVMQIAQELGGYSLGAADLLRRAMGKKKPEEMAKQRQIFLEGATARGMSEAHATGIFDLMEKFAGYGFNKSHSAAYALLSYQTAWLKAHYPAAFMAAVMSSDMDNTDKVVPFIEEARSIGLAVERPDVNACHYRFTASDRHTILYGLGAVKGVGRAAIDAITGERDASGPFADLFDFCQRVDLRAVNRRTIEALIRAGALDALGTNRASLMATLPEALSLADQASRNAAAGQNDLFGLEPAAAVTPAATEVADYSDDERLRGEKETLGLYLTGHPVDRYDAELNALTTARLADLGSCVGQRVVVAGLVIGLSTRRPKNADADRPGKMAFLTLDDRTGRLETIVFPEAWEQHRHHVGRDQLVVATGALEEDDYTGGLRLTVDELMDIEQARTRFLRGIVIDLDGGRTDETVVEELRELLTTFGDGPCRVAVDYANHQARARLFLSGDWSLRPADECLHRLRRLAGEEAVALEYGSPAVTPAPPAG
ncbi:DNA polymerase III, alpha subunit [Thiohalospira halophila DSM 15071]|uniref:DNA polymerase III subunit alpha n=1 Tax=Thiohalospira halophila DSM 15071 TaxID=1123397 RepID=A0A1I1PA33_9GAMM|nr:DNA polymerase III subunit alpha [Thiohalospira halophila]SFD06811.1 DNA polymerase III, alpha subunit [Thiohalospira halophila DSM 15071]